MVTYSLESTSTTTGMSDSGFNSDETSITEYIGDIYLAPKQRSASEADSESTAAANDTSALSHDDSLSYDSFMKEIQTEVWQKVRQAKNKKMGNTEKQNLSQTETATQRVSEPLQLENKKFIKLPQTQSNTNEPESSSNLRAAAVEWPRDHIQQYSINGQRLVCGAGIYSSRQSEDLPQQPSTLPSSRESSRPSTPSTSRQTAKEPTTTRIDPETIWDIEDDIGSLLLDETLVVDEPSACDPFDGIHEEEMLAISNDTARLKQLEQSEIDSVFESILSIDLEGCHSHEVERVNCDRPVRGTAESPTTTMTTSEPLLKARIFGSKEDTILCVPLSLIEKRENEMFKRAFKAGIKPDQWSGSLLSRRFKRSFDPSDPLGVVVTINLHPEVECADANYSQDFLWQSWIHECIFHFYKTGTMRIPDSCTGSDILVALQYFGILFNPDQQLIFDTFSSYLRVKLWSDYFTHRSTMATWIVMKISKSHGQQTHVFITFPNPPKPGYRIRVGSKKADVFEGGILLDSKNHRKTKSSTIVHSFFNANDDDENTASTNTDRLMRDDFCKYFQKILPGTTTSCSKKRVIISHPDRTREKLELATFYVHFETTEHNKTEELSFNCEERRDATGDLDTTNNSTVPDRYTRRTCRALNAPTLAGCTTRDTPVLVEHHNGNGREQWMPVGNPDRVSTSTYHEHKESRMPRVWMSGKHEAPEPTLGMESEKINIQHFEPFPTVSDKTESEAESELTPLNTEDVCEMFPAFALAEGSNIGLRLKVDHVYEDLWIQDTAFRDRWEREALIDWIDNNKTISNPRADRNLDGLHMPKAFDDEKQHPRSFRAKMHPKIQSLLDRAPSTTSDYFSSEKSFPSKNVHFADYKAKDFVCDIVELFEPSTVTKGGASRVPPKVRSCLYDSPPRRGRRQNHKRNKHFRSSRNTANSILDDCTDTSTTVSSYIADVLPRGSLIPGIDFPDDESR